MSSEADLVVGPEHADLPDHIRRHQTLTASDAQLRALVPDPAVEALLAVADTPHAELVRAVLGGYAERPALGSRRYDVVHAPDTGRSSRQLRAAFDTVTYGELHDRITTIASAFRRAGSHRVEPGDSVCIFGFNGTDYVTAELASVLLAAVSVPLSISMGRSAVEEILTDCAPVVVAAALAELPAVAELVADQRSVHTLIALDVDDRVDDDRDALASAASALAQRGSRTRLVALTELIAHGDPLAWNPPPPHPEALERTAALIHSSGSTGTPKGAILTERLAKREFTPLPVPLPLVRLSLMPLNHASGRAAVYGTLAHGGTVFSVARPDLSTLFDDLRLVRPTDGTFFPRVLDTVYGQFLKELAHRRSHSLDDEQSVRQQILDEMRTTVFGDRLCLLRVGGAPISAEVREFLTEGLGIGVVENYGATEAGSLANNGRVDRGNVIAYRLRDVPELGYHTTDEPYPRGELCVRTRHVVSGYFKRPDATASLFDADGFLITGDIVEERAPDQLTYVARRNDVLKLAQGEFVTLGPLGETFEYGSPLIFQIFLYGSSYRPYLLAVVVPDLELVRATTNQGPTESELRDLIRSELRRVAAAADLKPFEVPRDFLIETEPFSRDNGLLTALRKRIRPAIQRKYADRLEALYAELDRKQHADAAALRESSAELTVLERVGKALEASLGIEHVDLDTSATFTELGGDSLGAIEFAALLEDLFAVEVSVNSILSPAGNPRTWARMVEQELRSGARERATFVAVHGEGAQRLRASDLDLATFLDSRLFDGPAPEPVVTSPSAVLLTGATGFLGRFLCLEWLKRLSTAGGGKLICLVRATSHENAVRRLASSFAAGDPALDRQFRELAADRLEVLVGDIADTSLGLDGTTFERLAHGVDRIVHPAALVNHLLDYEYLFDPNAAGTAALIELAVTHRLKPIDFVSSAAVQRFLDASSGLDEDSPLQSTIELDRSYASGYGASKWAAELLLHAANRDFGLPVNVFRGDMMLPHRSFQQQINADDFFTRLLYSIVTTNLAPSSFYVRAPDGSRTRAHYDGLPVDFVAAAITEIGSRPHQGIRTFNVSNHADDGLSLDVFVDWIIEAGHQIERVADYAEWLTRFEAELQALPDDKRQLSSVQLLDALREPAAPTTLHAASQRFDAALRTLQVGPETPRLTREYIEKCLDDMVRLGLLPAHPHR